MDNPRMLTEQIVAVARQVPDCTIEDVQAALPGCTWNQLFLEIDRMSRTGLLRLSKEGGGSYRIRLAEGRAQECVVLAGAQQAQRS